MADTGASAVLFWKSTDKVSRAKKGRQKIFNALYLLISVILCGRFRVRLDTVRRRSVSVWKAVCFLN